MSQAGGATVGQVAAALQLDVRRVQQLANEGVIPKASRGRYNLAGCLHGYIGYLRDRASPSGGSNAEASRARKLAAEAELAELQLQRERGQLVEAERFERTLARAFGRVRSRLLSLPSRVGPEMVGVKDELAAEQVLDRYVLEVLEELRTEDVPMDSEEVARPAPAAPAAPKANPPRKRKAA